MRQSDKSYLPNQAMRTRCARFRQASLFAIRRLSGTLAESNTDDAMHLYHDFLLNFILWWYHKRGNMSIFSTNLFFEIQKNLMFFVNFSKHFWKNYLFFRKYMLYYLHKQSYSTLLED